MIPLLIISSLIGELNLNIEDILTSPSPYFATIVGIDKEHGQFFYQHVTLVFVYDDESIVENHETRQVRQARARTELRTSYFDVKEWPVTDVRGRRLKEEDIWKHASIGTTVVVSVDGEKVDSRYLKTLRAKTLVLIPPVTPPEVSPPMARPVPP